MESEEFSSFRRRLIRWYGKHGRVLPWRRNADPYQIWISEIMLQQTTVAAVTPYFERFLTRFPSVIELAAADESDVLRLWEGLGYYSRARNIHKAAKAIVEQYSGQFPANLESLIALPGIGRYTAGAIASFAFDQRAPIVEANTLRLYSRLLGYQGDPRSKEGQLRLWGFAEAILPKTAAGQLNQALMDLGATVCTPKEPRCDLCPVQMHCRSLQQGIQSTVPKLKVKVAVTEVTEVSVAIRNRQTYLLRKRTEAERWAGLWDFVRFEIPAVTNEFDAAQLGQSVFERTGLSVEFDKQIAELKHSVTRYRITLKCYTAKRVNGRLTSGQEWKWVNPTDFNDFPLSVTARQFAERLKS